MKVFKNKMVCVYGAGVALVAANSAEEAHCVCAQSESGKWLYEDFDPKTYEHLDNPSDWWSEHYLKENWKEVEGLTYEGDEPKLIVEQSYME